MSDEPELISAEEIQKHFDDQEAHLKGALLEIDKKIIEIDRNFLVILEELKRILSSRQFTPEELVEYLKSEDIDAALIDGVVQIKFDGVAHTIEVPHDRRNPFDQG